MFFFSRYFVISFVMFGVKKTIDDLFFDTKKLFWLRLLFVRITCLCTYYITIVVYNIFLILCVYWLIVILCFELWFWKIFLDVLWYKFVISLVFWYNILNFYQYVCAWDLDTIVFLILLHMHNHLVCWYFWLLGAIQQSCDSIIEHWVTQV